MDLFCGAGGLTHGLIDAGVRVVAGVDFDEACEHPYTANHVGIAFHRYDVAKLKASGIREWFGDAQIRVLAGCAPCQPFSSYSQRYETVGTERWGLLNHFARLVGEVDPDIVTMENVPTVTKHKIFDDFVATLEGQGYEVWYDVIDCSEYGLPQRRRRLVLLASLHGPIALHDPDASETKTVRDVLKGLPCLRYGGSDKNDPLHTASSLSPLNLERIKASRPGGSWRDWPKHLVAECHRKKTGKTYPGVYGRMRWDEPAPTLTTQFYGFGNGRFGHPTQARGLSLREGAILQGFPHDYSFVSVGKPIQFKVLVRSPHRQRSAGRTRPCHRPKHHRTRQPARRPVPTGDGQTQRTEWPQAHEQRRPLLKHVAACSGFGRRTRLPSQRFGASCMPSDSATASTSVF